MKNYLSFSVIALLTACTQGNIDVQLGAARNDPGGTTQWVTLSTFQSAPENQWVKDAGGSIYTNQGTLSFSGTCMRSVEKIRVKIDQQAQTTLATCGPGGTFSWSLPSVSEATHAFEFVGLDLSNQEFLPSRKQTVVVDFTPPVNPVVTTGTSPYNSPTTHLDLQGTTSADTVSVTISGASTSVSVSANHFSAPIQLVGGQTLNLMIRATDLAGNVSSGTSFQILYGVDRVLASTGFTVTALATPVAGSTTTLEKASMDPQAGSPNEKSSNGSSLYRMFLGFINHLYR